MATQGSFPTYECIGDSGIEGDEIRFTVRVLFNGESLGEGSSRSKRSAERIAAEAALERRAGADSSVGS